MQNSAIDDEAREIPADSAAPGHGDFPEDAAPTQEINSSLTLHWISYALHIIVAVTAVLPGLQFSPLLLLIAVILDLAMAAGEQPDILAQHYRWRISSVIWSLIFYAITAPLWLLILLPGVIAWFCISLWLLYRVLRGCIALSRRRAVI